MKSYLTFVGFVFILLLQSSAQQGYTNLVFEGAGIKGLAYSGVVAELEERGIMDQIERVGGTSAGAITAMLLAVGYDSQEMADIISSTKFQSFNDGGFPLFGGIFRMKNRYGWYKGARFSNWVGELLEAKTGNEDITFEELAKGPYKELFVTATSLTSQQTVVLSQERYPRMRIKDAVRISMSIPLYFQGVWIDSSGQIVERPASTEGLELLIDGGLLANYPIFLFDEMSQSEGKAVRIANPATLGVRMDTDNQIHHDSTDHELEPQSISSISDYAGALFILTVESLNRQWLTEEDWNRTISVSSLDIGPKIKKMSEEQKQALYDSGKTAARLFLDHKSTQ